MTTFDKGVGPCRAGGVSAIRKPLRALAVVVLLLGTTAIFEPGVARAQDFSGLIGMAMRHYGGFSYNGRDNRHPSRHATRHREPSRHREGPSHEARRTASPAASEEPTIKSASPASSSISTKASDEPNFTPAR
jgi:hypothetical protein